MNSRLFHLKDVSCKIVNCTHVAKIENMTNKTKSIEIDRSFCIALYTNIKSFGPALLRPPYTGRRFFLPQQNLFLHILLLNSGAEFLWVGLSICRSVWLFPVLLLTEAKVLIFMCISQDTFWTQPMPITKPSRA